MESLCYLAEQGWVHRDVKPDNFLISPQGELKLIDFALAVRPKSGLARMFALKAKPQGTMSYMPPEQILGKPVDLKADVYSLACTVFELVSGKKPFTGMSTNELLQKHVAGPIPALEAANRNVTVEFGSVIRRCLAKEPADRPTMADFRRELQSIALFKMRPKPPGEVRTGPAARRCRRLPHPGKSSRRRTKSSPSLLPRPGNPPPRTKTATTWTTCSRWPSSCGPPQPATPALTSMSQIRRGRPGRANRRMRISTSRTIRASTSNPARRSGAKPNHGQPHPAGPNRETPILESPPGKIPPRKIPPRRFRQERFRRQL